ncbi:c-type cytochrome [Pararoseomonas indoligenes]|uniref:C-type cytochrome n=1 Tax=Roseomonas indoligenes TaxID=2820811 RepID=A0A940N4Q2_9PROT|nr:c-type cytochrome [Pararoseomonas indoligenes]MBP0495125.1 c-type cytochrome [Pararoseomonas indoligenes]
MTGARKIVLGVAALGGLAGGILAWGPSTGPARPGGEPSPGAPASASAAAGGRLFRACAACHTIGRGAPDLSGPNLHGVLGAPVGGNRPHYGYTRALLSAGGRWTVERLDDWLRDPQAFAPGTRMTIHGVARAQDRADLIAYLAGQGP